MSVRARLSAVLTIMLAVAQLAVTVRADGPLTLDEIAALRERKQNPGQIVRLAKERGRGFAVDDAARERLQTLGFNATAIAALGKATEKAPPVGLGPAQDPPAVGDDPEAELVDRIVRETVAKAGVRLTAWEGERGRIFSGPGVPPQFTADAKQLESRLGAVFPRSFVAGIDKRAVNVAIVATRSDYALVLEAVGRAAEQHGRSFVREDGRSLQDLGAGKPALYLPGLTTMCLESTPPEHARRTVVHALGYHALEHVSRRRAGDALAGGFGNVTEVMLFQTPGTTVAGGYADRELGGGGGWPDLVRQRFAEQRIRGLGPTLAGDFATMEMPDYAEAWSLTALLCTAPQKFTAAVAAIRGGTESTKAIVAAYGGDEAAITREWQRRATAP